MLGSWSRQTGLFSVGVVLLVLLKGVLAHSVIFKRGSRHLLRQRAFNKRQTLFGLIQRHLKFLIN
jgi:hypothetical protein